MAVLATGAFVAVEVAFSRRRAIETTAAAPPSRASVSAPASELGAWLPPWSVRPAGAGGRAASAPVLAAMPAPAGEAAVAVEPRATEEPSLAEPVSALAPLFLAPAVGHDTRPGAPGSVVEALAASAEPRPEVGEPAGPEVERQAFVQTLGLSMTPITLTGMAAPSSPVGPARVFAGGPITLVARSTREPIGHDPRSGAPQGSGDEAQHGDSGAANPGAAFSARSAAPPPAPPIAAAAPSHPAPPPAAAAPVIPAARPPPASGGKVLVVTHPSRAQVFVDGVDMGRTPLALPASDEAREFVLFRTGHELVRREHLGRGTVRALLDEAPRFRGTGRLRIVCTTGRSVHISVDGRDTGTVCPSALIPVAPGEHTVTGYDLASGRMGKHTVRVVAAHRSVEVRVP